MPRRQMQNPDIGELRRAADQGDALAQGDCLEHERILANAGRAAGEGSRTLRIAQVAPLAESVPPREYGGTERVVSWLTEELVSRGHDVTLFAAGTSRTSATLVPVVERPIRRGGERYDPLAWHCLQAGQARARAGEFDVVHLHLEVLGLAACRGPTTPMLSTMHGRLDGPGCAELLAHHDDHPLVSISRSQRAPVETATWAANIYHGLPLDGYAAGPGDGGYFVFLGRMSPEKRPHAAIDTAVRAGVRLILAAKVGHDDRPYFEEVVRPRLAHPLIEFVGEVDEAAKVDLLRRAVALLFPILWPEPFGLAMVEALACGTPVITRRCGSTPEIVTHGRDGFICDDDEAVVEAIRRIEGLDRAACRRSVEERFSVERMTADYERLYRTLTERAAGTLESRANESRSTVAA